VIGVDFRKGDTADPVFFSDDQRCSISEEDGAWKIKIHPATAGESYPVCLRFSSAVPISGVGFAATKTDLACYCEAGPCGGCFYLDAAMNPPTTRTPLILDCPPPKGSPTYYHFDLCFPDGPRQRRIDPRIYNEGVGEGPWLRFFWCLVWRFKAWLRSFLGK
jgi:hypothetical protein